MEISKISANNACQPLKASEVKQNLSSNPFGVSFKGIVIHADVFEKAATPITKQISSKGRLFASAIVGNINNFNEAFKNKMNSVSSFARKITTNIAESFEKASNIEVSLDFDAFKTTFMNKFFPDNQYKVKNLMNQPVDNLKAMWHEALSV